MQLGHAAVSCPTLSNIVQHVPGQRKMWQRELEKRVLIKLHAVRRLACHDGADGVIILSSHFAFSRRNGNCNAVARPAPISGPTHITHRSSKPFLLSSLLQLRKAPMIAGPNERVGLIEQPSIGNKIKCARNTAKPIAMQAFWPTVAFLETAVSQTTKHRSKVPKISPTSARP